MIRITILLLNCNGKAQNNNSFWLDDISSKIALKDFTCKNRMPLIESSNIVSFVRELQKNYDTRLNRAILLFYIEGGEVIEFYSIAILISENNIHGHVNNGRASGYRDNSFPFTGDKERQFNHKTELDKKGLSLPLYYIYNNKSNGLYRYTPSYGDKFVKKINRSNDFYTGKYK